MRGARSSILESMKWTVQVRRAAITMRHHIHFNSDVFAARTVPDWQAPTHQHQNPKENRPAIRESQVEGIASGLQGPFSFESRKDGSSGGSLKKLAGVFFLLLRLLLLRRHVIAEGTSGYPSKEDRCATQLEVLK